MGALVVIEFVSLDGTMQGLHGADERGGFRHSGWGEGYADDAQFRSAVAALPSTAAYLFGRRTYEELASFWRFQPDDNPMAAHLNHTVKYVATHRDKPLEWANTVRLEGHLIDAVARLKATVDGNIAVLGSGNVVHQLVAADLPDAFRLLIHPLLLGSGHQLFPRHGRRIELHLGEVGRTSTGVVMLEYVRR
jgi:dihydrofolate reductase